MKDEAEKYIRRVFENKGMDMRYISLPRKADFKKGDYVKVCKVKL